MRPFSVYGYWPHSMERYGEVYEAMSARGAEDMMQMDAATKGLTFRVAGVLEGTVPSADRYTLYVDPRDVRNADVGDLVPDVAEWEVGRWSVMGLILAGHDHGWNERTGGQRFCDHVWATSALAAEDVAVSKVAEEGGRLLVCAVFAGAVQRADAVYAPFSDPGVSGG